MGPPRDRLADRDRPGGAGGSYRPEIDGLRAVAVLAVILYHAEVPGFAGGWFGVDIFFAISGFLITGIIVRSLADGRFRFADFYLRRIRRVVPALVVLCLLLVPLAWLLMMPDDLENFGQSLVANAVSANNVLLYLTSGYFQQESRFRPLFHTWSLGVEEQYYALVPLFLALAWRLGGKKGAFAVLAICSGLSLAACALLEVRDGEAAFLMLPTRIWELGLGGMAALAQPRLQGWLGPRLALSQALVGAGAIAGIGTIFWLPEPYEPHSARALAGVLGICALLALGSRNGVGRLLAAPPAVGLGLISYGAYLYHAPLFAFLTLVSLERPTWPHLLALVPLALALAWLSWRWVELPMRDAGRTGTRAVLVFSGAGLGAMALIGLALHLTGGLFRWSELATLDPQLARGRAEAYNYLPRAYQDKDFASTRSPRNLLVVGNSFARDFVNMGLETGQLRKVELSYASLQYCQPWTPALVERARRAGTVVLAAKFEASTVPCLRRVVERLGGLGVPRVIVVGTKNFGTNNSAVMLLPPQRRFAYRSPPSKTVAEANRAASLVLPAGQFVDPMAVLDDGSGTVPLFTPQHQLISWDTGHLTRAGARFVGNRLFAQPAFAWLRAIDQPPN